MENEDQGATLEVEREEIEQPKSMDDTIRETLRSLQAPEDTTTTAASATEAPEEAAQRIRDTQGKFAGKPADNATVIEPAAVTEPVSSAPNTWKKEVADTWSTLPAAVRAEVERREADFHKGIEQYKGAATFGQNIERAIAPYAQTIKNLGITPDKAIEGLMAADHKLRHGSAQEKSAYFAQLAQNYGIDLGQAGQQQQNIDPNMHALQQQVQQLQGHINSQHQAVQQQAQDSLNSEIASFAADPLHSHFDAVKGHMSALLQAGQATTLKDAYEQAIYANPATRGAVLQQQATAQRDDAAKKAQAAKAAASVNVRGRSAMPVSQPIGTMDDTIRATLRKLQGA